MPTLFDFSLKVALFVEEILEAEMRLVHFLTRCSGGLFRQASLLVGRAVDGLEARDECSGKDVVGLDVDAIVGSGDEGGEVVNDEVRVHGR